MKHSEEFKKRMSERMKGENNPSKREDVREKLSVALKGRKTPWLNGKKRPEHAKFMKERMLSVWSAECEERTAHLKALEKTRKDLQRGHSKLHDEVKSQLEEAGLKGFISEQIIDKLFVDEVNFEKRIVLEIQGDFWHANPRKFKASDIMTFPGRSILASDVWIRDATRRNILSALGYTVIEIWESDWNQNPLLQIERIKEFLK